MITVACGYDERERVGWEVFVSSVRRRTAEPVNFVRFGDQEDDRGTNAFTLARFLVPYRMRFEGRAIFCDAVDQVCLADIAELDALFDPGMAVQVVRHPDYRTRHPRKYVGTSMECDNRDYPRKNWASVMLINCEHPAWLWAVPSVVGRVKNPREILDLSWLRDEAIGALPDCWNRLVDEGQPVEGAKILHWTAGAPFLSKAYDDAPGAEIWRAERDAAT